MHLEVIGFTKEDIKRFAESVFSGDILAEFLSYITSNPPIYGMMYIPLNAVIVALIYQDSYNTDTPFPTTMTQLFDALTRALIRRHLVSTRQVSSVYCMPPSLQRKQDIGKLPPLVVEQLLQLARVAYERFHKKEFVFTDLGEDFEHLGMMKKTTSLNVCTGPGCSYSFLHLTLQEYVAALYIAIENPSKFELNKWLNEDSVAVRFVAGICMRRHDDYNDIRLAMYHKLVDILGCECYVTGSPIVANSLQLVHCAYECPSIMDSVKIDTIFVKPDVRFDWYAIGYCISHFDKIWGLLVDLDMRELGIDLLVKGLRSSPIAKGKIWYLSIQKLPLSKVQVMITELKDFCQIDSLDLDSVDFDIDDEAMLQLIAPKSGPKTLQYRGYVKPIPLFFKQSSVQELILLTHCHNVRMDLVPHSNTNLKKLTIGTNLLRPLTSAINNVTSLTYLEIIEPQSSDLPVLTKIVLLHSSLETLKIGNIQTDDIRLTDGLTPCLTCSNLVTTD